MNFLQPYSRLLEVHLLFVRLPPSCLPPPRAAGQPQVQLQQHTPLTKNKHNKSQCEIPVSCQSVLLVILSLKLTSFLSLYQAAVTVKISILLICFCSFDLFCPLLEKNSFIKNNYTALSCPIK